MKLSEGFTLIEVMIGILVFSIGILGVLSMQTTSIAANAKAQHTGVGSALASSILATLRPLDYDNLMAISGQPGPTMDPTKDAIAFYDIGLDINRLDGGQDPLDGEVAIISVHVGWEDYGRSHETTFHSFRQDELR